MGLLHAVVLFHTTGWKRSMRVNMKQTTRLHGSLARRGMFHPTGSKRSMRVKFGC